MRRALIASRSSAASSHELSSAPSIVVVDESQLLTSDCIELLRYLHDHRSTRFALVLVGGNGTWRVLSREPMLASRVYRRVRFTPLTRADVLAAIPAYHPMYADVDGALIALVDDVFAGNLRNWAAFTDSALRLRRQLGRADLDEQLTRNVFALHGGADR